MRLVSDLTTHVAIIDDAREEIAYVYDALELENRLSPIYGDWTKEDEKQALLDIIIHQANCVVLLDIFFHGEEKGLEIYQSIKQHRSDVPVLILTTRGDYETFKRYREIAFSYITKGEPVNNIINRIKLATEEGAKYHAEFTRLAQLFVSEPEEAIYGIRELFQKYSNVAAYKRHNELLKKYLERPFSQYRIPLTEILSLMRQNCLAIQKEDPADRENLADLAIVYLHTGEKNEATKALKTIFAELSLSSATTNEIISWLEREHLRQFGSSPSAEWLSRQVIGNYATNHEGHLHFLEILRKYNDGLWEAGVVNWFQWIAKTWDRGDKKALAELTLDCFLLFGGKALWAVVDRQDADTKDRMVWLSEEVFRLAVHDIDIYNLGLVSLCKFVFDIRDFGVASELDNQLSYALLEEFLLGLYGLDEPLNGAVALVCELMARLRFSDVNKIHDVLRSIQTEHTALWWEAFQGFVAHLRQTHPEKLQDLIQRNIDYLLGTLKPDSLYWLGSVLDEAGGPPADSEPFYNRALELVLSRAKSENDLLEARAMIDTLKRNKIHSPNYLEDKFRSRIAEIQRPLKLWDGKRIAVMGGKPDREIAYKEKLEKAFGGQYEWYHPNQDRSLKRLASSVRSGGVDIVIYITGWGSHMPNDMVVPTIEEINKYSAGSHLINLIRVPREKTGAGEVVQFIQEHLVG